MREKIISCLIMIMLLVLFFITAVIDADDSGGCVLAPSSAAFVWKGWHTVRIAAKAGEGDKEDQTDTDGRQNEEEMLLKECPDESDEETLCKVFPAVPDLACFTYEELADGTLRLTGYDESKNTQNPYQVILPSEIDGKRVSTIGTGCLGGYHGGYSNDLLELTIPDGVTTLEANVIEGAYDIASVTVPDSVSQIDEKAFWRNDYQQDLVIACHDTSYAYQYAQEHDFSCRVLEPVLPENAFLSEYAEGPSTGLAYFGHYRTEGTQYDYISMEYRFRSMEHCSMEYWSTGIVKWEWQRNNEFLVLVVDKESGEVLQCVDSSCLDPEHVAFYRLDGLVTCKNFLSIEDWNFDGMEDLCCWQGFSGGTDASSFHEMFFYEKESGLYVHDKGLNSPYLREDKQCIYEFFKGGASYHYVVRNEYVDGVLTHVATLDMEGITSEDHVEGVEITDRRLINGEWQIYRHEIFWGDMGAENPVQDAYDRSEILYVNDGYWDLW